MKTQTFEILPVSPEEWAICRELALELAGNLAPCSCAGAVEYIVHSCTVLVAKHDLPPQSIHRLDQTRTGLVDKSQLM